MVKKTLLAGLLCCSPYASAHTQWFAIVGDPADAVTDTVEVDPGTFNGTGAFRTVRVRVSRSSQRTSWDGVPYRSYVSDVLINCASRSGRYMSIDFFAQPVWQGDTHGKTFYPPGEIRPMLFLDMTPNPTQRLIRAACQSDSVKTR